MALPAQHVDLAHLPRVPNEDELIARHIVPHPTKRGRAFARLKDSGYSIAVVIGYLKSVDGDVQETARSYELPEEAMLAALAFYRLHQDVIDARHLLDGDDDWPER